MMILVEKDGKQMAVDSTSITQAEMHGWKRITKPQKEPEPVKVEEPALLKRGPGRPRKDAE